MGVVDDVQDRLQAQGLIDGATGWPSVRRYLHEDSDQLVVLTEDGGPPPEMTAASGLGETAETDAGIQVRVRAEPGDSDASFSRAKAIYDDLHGLKGVTLGSTDYHRVAALSPEPVFMGFDDEGRPEHTISFRLLADA